MDVAHERLKTVFSHRNGDVEYRIVAEFLTEYCPEMATGGNHSWGELDSQTSEDLITALERLTCDQSRAPTTN